MQLLKYLVAPALFTIASCATDAQVSSIPPAAASTAENCEAPIVENAAAKAELMKQTQLVYVRSTDPSVPDADDNTVQYMVMDQGDERPSHVSADGQVIVLRAETNDEACSETFTRLLDESFEKRLLRAGTGGGP